MGMIDVLNAKDPAWSVSYTPWGDKIICHLTVNGVTRSAVAATDRDAFIKAFRMF